MKNEVRCKFCALPISFESALRKDGRQFIKPINLDGTSHLETCTRIKLFGRSIVHCKGCDSNLIREAGEWQQGNYFDFEKQTFVDGRWFPLESFRVLYCPSCNFFYSWDAVVDGIDFPDVEKVLLKEDISTWWKLQHGDLKILPLAKT